MIQTIFYKNWSRPTLCKVWVGDNGRGRSDPSRQLKTTLKLYRDPATPTKAYSYEISNIEVLTGTARAVTLPNVQTSMDASSLLYGVRRVNGELFVNRKDADKRSVEIIQGGA